jgi:hypothetical protein
VVLHEGTPGRRGVARSTDELLTGLAPAGPGSAGRGMAAVTVTGLVARRRVP